MNNTSRGSSAGVSRMHTRSRRCGLKHMATFLTAHKYLGIASCFVENSISYNSFKNGQGIDSLRRHSTQNGIWYH